MRLQPLLYVVLLLSCKKPEEVKHQVELIQPLSTEEFLQNSTLSYVSDYISFAGADASGNVGFAIDTNRGQDGKTFQAEHMYAVLYDTDRWLDLEGAGEYKNTKKELVEIPSSGFFRYTGTPEAGLTIDSPKNKLKLQIEPITETLPIYTKHTIYRMGVAAATLTFEGRSIQGRVIYEYLVKNNANMITQPSYEGFDTATWLYLRTEKNEDLYVQHVGGAMAADIFESKDLGFWVRDGRSEMLQELNFIVEDRSAAPGFYRFEREWRIEWKGAVLTLKRTSREKVGSWVIAGFSMATVEGELSYQGETIKVFGLAELLAF
jgi:hypothetical protein